jgi:hypothetical protein
VGNLTAKVVKSETATDKMMITHEHAGGDGWWKGWEMLKAAYRKAGLTHNAPWFEEESDEITKAKGESALAV